MANAHLATPKIVPIHCPIVAFSYRYEMQNVSDILLQNQKHVVCKFQTNISDRKKIWRCKEWHVIYSENTKCD